MFKIKNILFSFLCAVILSITIKVCVCLVCDQFSCLTFVVFPEPTLAANEHDHLYGVTAV